MAAITFFTLGLNTGATKYKTWSIQGSITKNDVSTSSGANTTFDLSLFGGSGTVKNEVGKLACYNRASELNSSTWILNFNYDITSVNILAKNGSKATPTRHDDWVTVENNTVKITTNVPTVLQDSYYILVLINTPLGVTKYPYTENLTHITSNALSAYEENTNFDITYTADENYLIDNLTSNLGLVTINSDKKGGSIIGIATGDINVTGSASLPKVKATYNLTGLYSNGKSSYNLNSEVTITITPYAGYQIGKLTSTLGTVVIAENKLSATITLTATEDFTITGAYSEIYGKVTISGSFANCTCNYNNGEEITAQKGRVTITANSGYVFQSSFTYYNQDDHATEPLEISSDGTYLFIYYKGNIDLNDTYTAIKQPQSLGGFTHLYLTNNQELNSLSKVRFYDNEDYGKDILQLYVLPYNLPSDIIGDKSSIILGQYDSKVESTTILNYTCTISYGDIVVPAITNNVYDFLDTICTLRLPFFDPIQLDTEYCIGQTLHIDYTIDLYSGTCGANITSTFTNTIIQSVTNNIVTQIPFIQKTTDSVINQLSTNLLNPNNECYLEVVRNIPYNPENNIFGKPAKIVDTLKNYTGYIKVDDIDLVTSANTDEIEQIIKLLNKGVFIN